METSVRLPAVVELQDGRFVTWNQITKDELKGAIALLTDRLAPLKEDRRQLLWAADHFDELRASMIGGDHE